MTGDEFNVEQAMAVGPNARARAKSVQFFRLGGNSQIDPARLASELQLLRAEVRDYPDVDPDDRDRAVGALLEAQRGAENGDEDRVRKNLARTGKWVLKVAESIGVGVAVAALRQVLVGG